MIVDEGSEGVLILSSLCPRVQVGGNVTPKAFGIPLTSSSAISDLLYEERKGKVGTRKPPPPGGMDNAIFDTPRGELFLLGAVRGRGIKCGGRKKDTKCEVRH